MQRGIFTRHLLWPGSELGTVNMANKADRVPPLMKYRAWWGTMKKLRDWGGGVHGTNRWSPGEFGVVK